MEPMKIVWCEKCTVGHPVFPEGMEENSDEAARERCVREHLAEMFVPIKGSFVTRLPNLEIYFLATNPSGEKFVGFKYRKSIQEPFCYRFFRGILRVEITDLKLQEQELRQSLGERALIGGIVLGKDKIDLVIAFLDNQIKLDRYDDMALTEVFDRSEWQKDGFNVFIALNQRLTNYMKNRCSDFLTRKEMDFFVKFIEEENVEGGVLVCLGRCKVYPEYR